METQTVKVVSAIFILLLTAQVHGQPKRLNDGDDPNERPLKVLRIEDPSQGSMSSDDDWIWFWDTETSENILANRNANPEFSEATALLFAGAQTDERGAAEIVDFALARGADVNAIANDGMTPLMCFAQIGNEEVMTALIQNHADMNILDPHGNSLLIVAMTAEYAQVSTAQFLVNHGAEIGDKEIQTAFDVAEQYRNGHGMDDEDMFNEWTDFANYLLRERMARFTTQMSTFSQANLPQNVQVELPTDVLNYIGGFLWAATSHL